MTDTNQENIEYSLFWLYPDLYDEYNLDNYNTNNTLTFPSIGGTHDPREVLSTQHINGEKWDFLLGVDDKGEPFGTLAIQWHCLDGYTLTPILHYDVFKGQLRFTLKCIVDILSKLCTYYCIDKLTICDECSSREAWRFQSVVDLSEVTRRISIPSIKRDTLEYVKQYNKQNKER